MLMLTAAALASAVEKAGYGAFVEIRRMKSLLVSDVLLDIWYNDTSRVDGKTWKRPDVIADAFTLGVLRDMENGWSVVGSGSIYVPRIETGYWDDLEDPPDSTDGHVVSFDSVRCLGFDIQGYYSHPFNRWIGMTFGVGLGIPLIRLGQPSRWSAEDGQSATEIYEDGGPPNDAMDVPRVPVIFPVLSGVGGFRVTPVDALALQVEAGFWPFLYVGASARFVF